MLDSANATAELMDELEALRRRLMELEEMEVMRVSEELERFDSLQVLDEYAKQLEESRDKVARLLRAGTAVQAAQSVDDALDQIAKAVGQAGWGSVSVILMKDWDVIQSAYFGCSPADVEFLEQHRRPPSERARFYGPDFDRFKISRSYFVPAERFDEVLSTDNVVPGRRAIQPGDTWNPMDLAYVPMYGSQGNIIGSINCDDPVDGRRPSAETFFYLELFADLAARKVEMAQLTEQQHRTKEALLQSEEKYRTVFTRSEDGFFLMDHLFRDCNSKACELWGCQPEDIIGHSPAEFSPEFQPGGRLSCESSKEHIDKAIAGDPQKFYWQHKRKDGALLDCEVSLAAVEVNDEMLVLAIVRDISERLRAELERETVFHILQIANELVDQEQMITRIFNEIGKLIPLENYYIAVYDEQANTLTFPHFVDEKDPPPPMIPVGKGLTSWMVMHKKPLRLGPADFERLIEDHSIVLQGSTALSWLGVPLISRSKTIGALVLQSYRHIDLYTENHLRILSALAVQIATILERRMSDEAMHLTQFMVDRGADAIFWIGADGRILYVNDEACNALEYSKEELLTLSVPAFDPTMTPDRWYNHWQDVKHKGTATIETVHRTRSGRCYPAEVTLNYLRFNGKEIHCAFSRDITDRKRAEEVQRVLFNISEATSLASNLDQLLETIRRELSSLVNTANFFVALYDAATGLYTYPFYADEEDAAPQGPEELDHSLTDYVRRAGKPILVDDAIRGELERAGEAKGRGTRSCQWLGVPLKTAKGVIGVVTLQSYRNKTLYSQKDLDLLVSVSGPIAMAIDRKRAEDQRRESEDKFRILVQNMEDAICICDEQGQVVFANNAAGALFGLPRETLQNRKIGELVDISALRPDDTVSDSGRSTAEMAVANGAGIRNVLLARTTQTDIEAGFKSDIYVFYDFTVRKRATEELRQSEARYRTLIEMSPDAIVLYQDLKLIYVNHAALQLLGAKRPEDLLGKNVMELVHPDCKELVRKRIALLENGQAVSLIEEKFQRLDGATVDVEATALPTIYQNRPAIQVVWRDLTEKNRDRNRLHMLEQAMDAIPEIVYLMDSDGKFGYINPAFSRVYGYTKQELLGMPVPGIFIGEGAGEADAGSHTAKIVNKTRSGEPVAVRSTVYPVSDDQGKIIARLVFQKIENEVPA